jgi:hypothetical protein
MIGEGDQWGGAGGGTIGSGDPFGQFNNFLRWDLEDIADEPGRFEITVWLDKSAPKGSCTVDLTPRRCQKFRPRPGEKFTVTIAPAGGKETAAEATADPSGLVTATKLTVATDKTRVRIARK